MKIIVTGATGFLGKTLADTLKYEGHEVAVLTRNVDSAEKTLGNSADEFHAWNPEQSTPPERALKNADAVVHLCGENIFSGYWTRQKKQRIYDSRILSTRHLFEGIHKLPEGQRPKRILCASAMGFYGDTHDDVVDETRAPGGDFLARVCADWENEARQGLGEGSTLVTLRSGIVLGRSGGALKKFLPSFKWGLGATLGSGHQWTSWIHEDDWVQAVIFLLNSKIQGPVNLVAPKPVLHSEFVRTLANVTGKRAFLRVPAKVLEVGMGEMASALLNSNRVIPKQLLDHGFKFRFQDLELALKDLVGR